MIALTDEDLMPFGKFSRPPDGPLKMKDVPASYLLWLWDDGVRHQQVRHYIIENMDALKDEDPDWIPEDER